MAAARVPVKLEELRKHVVEDGDDRGCVSNEIDYYWTLLSTPWLSTNSSSVISGIHQLNEDWSFLSTLVESISRWSNADEAAFGGRREKNENVVLLAPKIEAAAKKIGQILQEEKRYFRESEFLDIVLYCQMETQRLMAELRDSVDHLSRCSFQVHIRPLALRAGDAGGHPSFSFNDWFSHSDGRDHDHPIPNLSDDDGFIPSLSDEGSYIRFLSDDDGGDAIPGLFDDDGRRGDDVYFSCPDDDDVYFSCSDGDYDDEDDDDDNDSDDDWFSFWSRFVQSVLSNLRIMLSTVDIQDKDSCITRKQVSALYKELELIRDYILGVCGSSLDFPAAAGEPYVVNIDNFFNHVASVIVHIAMQSCNYWLHYSTRTAKADPPIEEGNKIKFAKFLMVEDLQHEVDPTNPYFMELHLHFFIALSKVGVCQDGNLVDSFCKYYFQRRQGDLRDEVSSLLTCFLESMSPEEEEEVVQSLSEEIKGVLLWISSLLDVVHKEGLKMEVEEVVYLPFPPCSEFLTEICLLKAELILKKLLHHISLTNKRWTLSMIPSRKNRAKDEFNHILQNLRRYIRDLPLTKIEHGKKALAVIEQVADEVVSLCQSFEANKISESVLNSTILGLVLEIVVFRTESILMGLILLKSSGSVKTSMADEDQIPFLLEELNFLKPILSSKRLMQREETDMRFLQIEALLRGITCLSYSNPTNINTVQDMIKKKVFSSCELLDKVKHLKPMLSEIGPQFPLSKLPKMHNMEFIDFLTNLGELLRYFLGAIAPLKHYVEEIQLHLKSLSPLIKVLDPDVNEHPGLEDLGDRITEIAYKVEYIVDLILGGPQLEHFFWFFHELKKLRLVNEQAAGIHLTNSNDNVQNVNDVTQDSLNMISQDGRPGAVNEKEVDLSDQEQVIINHLTRGLRRHVVSIVGMPGIGKTTLAWKVYNHQNVVHRFHCRAWCYVSQVYAKRELLLGILHDIHGLTDEIRRLSNEDLESKLRQCLLRRKYLIVMDDMWHAGAWSDLKNCFPDDANGSRILITSRLRDVALEIEPDGDPHSLRALSGDESWKLLEGKIFQREACPQELLLVGKEIAQKCEGLPLAIVAISGLLQRTDKKKELWENISKSLSSEIMNDPKSRCNEIFELSYKHLPGYLKACFLYLGAFLGDRDIPVTKLIRFWLAEGFIQNTESKRMEDVAEANLVDLINRSLVIISKRKSNGKVKACRLHDLILDFCRSKAKDENFLQLVTRCSEPYSSFPKSDYGFEFDFYHQLDLVEYKVYRLCILLKRNHFVESRPSGLGTRSLIFFASTDSEPRCPYDISFVCHNFKFLRVLDFECINIGVSFPAEIELLVLLRYLAVSGYLHHIPKSIANLSRLETLIVKGLRGKVVLPDTVWGMTRLRHLHVNVHVTFNLDDEDVGDFELENLVSFSCPSLSCGDDTRSIMKRLPNLRKLKCIFFESWDSSKNCNQFPRLDFLTKLESVNIFYYGTPLNTSEFNLPLNLKELTLSNFCLPWDCISLIGKLPNLAFLKLLAGAFEGQRWDMREEEFLELKFLKLESLNISQWNGSSDHLPKLQRLVLQNCKDLEKIPCDFADIDTLEMIEVHWCGQSVEDSAKEIGKATEGIKVLISSSSST